MSFENSGGANYLSKSDIADSRYAYDAAWTQLVFFKITDTATDNSTLVRKGSNLFLLRTDDVASPTRLETKHANDFLPGTSFSFAVDTWYLAVVRCDGAGGVRVSGWNMAGSMLDETSETHGTYTAQDSEAITINVNSTTDSLRGRVAYACYVKSEATDTEIGDYLTDPPTQVAAWGAAVSWFLTMTDSGAMGEDSGPNGYDFTPGGTVTYSSDDPPVTLGGGDVDVAPGAADAASAASGPTIVLGAITIASGGATATSTAAGPTIILGAIAITPGAAQAPGTAGGPTVSIILAPLSPGAAQAQGTAGGPTIVLGSITLSPGAAQAASAAGDPTIDAGDLQVAPGAAQAASAANVSAIVQGSITLSPGAAQVAGAASIAAMVLGSIALSPGAAQGTGTASGPTIIQSAIVIASGGATATSTAAGPTIILGAIAITPGAAQAQGTAGGPTVSILVIAIMLTLPARTINLTLQERGRAITLPARTLDLTLKGR